MRCIVNQLEFKGVQKESNHAIYAVQLFAWMTSDELKAATTKSGEFEAVVQDEVLE